MAEGEGGGGALRSLLAYFNVKVDEKELEHAHESIEKFKEELKEFGETVLAAFAIEKIHEFADSMIEMGEEIFNSAQKLGTTTDELQKLRGAMELTTGSAESADMMIMRLNRTLASGKKDEAFAKLGVEPKDAEGNIKKPTELLEEMAEGFAKLPDHIARVKVATELWGRQGQGLVTVLEKGKEGVHDLFKEVGEANGVLDEGFIKEAKEAGDAMKKFDMSIRALKVSMISSFIPGIQKSVEAKMKYVKMATEVIRKTDLIKEALEVMAAVGIYKVVKALKELNTSVSFLTLGKGKGWVSKIFGLGELGLVAAVIAVIALGFEDFFGFLQGKDSVIGSVMDKKTLDAVRKSIDDISRAWDGMWQSWGGQAPDMKQWLDGVATAIITIVEVIIIAVKAIAGLITGLVGLVDIITELAANGTDAAGKKIDSYNAKLFGANGLISTIPQNLDTIGDAFNSGTKWATPGQAQPGGGRVGDQVWHVGGIVVNVQGEVGSAGEITPADVEALRKAIASGLLSGVDQANLNAGYAALTTQPDNSQDFGVKQVE